MSAKRYAEVESGARAKAEHVATQKRRENGAKYADCAGFTQRGNAIGFTSGGEIITGEKVGQVWRVEVGCDLHQPLARDFGWLRDALDYGKSLIDERRSRELAWWDA